ncbi:MAG: hypothetical protein ACR2NZ_15000 [Rubripirellula sp.]
MSKKLVALMTGSLLMFSLVTLPVLADDDDSEPKFSTKEVMKKAMKGGLLKKVASGDASEEETKQLHSMLVALSKNEPKKGDAESWKKMTGALVKASTAAVDGDPEAGAMLKKAANCKACHNLHK